MQTHGKHDKKTGRLIQPQAYPDGMTKQAFRDECDIQKIMARAEKGGTISHLQKHEGAYEDFSDFDFHAQSTMLTKGREIFDDLPAEIRKEFGQSPQAFFTYVNDPANKDDLLKKLPALAQPGRQLPAVVPPNADEQAASAAASEPASEKSPTAAVEAETPPAEAEGD